jgi:hypothetical protein
MRRKALYKRVLVLSVMLASTVLLISPSTAVAAGPVEFFDNFESYAIGSNPTEVYEFLGLPYSSEPGPFPPTDLWEVGAMDANQVLQFHYDGPCVHFPQHGKLYRREFSSISEAGVTFYRTQHSMGWTSLLFEYQDDQNYNQVLTLYTNRMYVISQGGAVVEGELELWTDTHIQDVSHRIEVRRVSDQLIASVTRLDTNETKALVVDATDLTGGRAGFKFHDDWPGGLYANVDDFYVKGEPNVRAAAAELSKEVVGAPYLGDGTTWGGKGWDEVESEFVDPAGIIEGYHYWNNALGKVAEGAGLDCSGLVYWAYNKASGAVGPDDALVYYKNADGQYQYNSSPVTEDELEPGDLMFLDHQGDGRMDHVAMFVGGHESGDVIYASTSRMEIIWSEKDRLKRASPGSYTFARITAPTVSIKIRSDSPVDLEVTDPDGSTINAQTVILTEFEWLREIPGVLYYSESDIDGDGEIEDLVFSPELKPGFYHIAVVPEAGALPTEVFSLEVEAAGTIVVLAESVAIGDAPIQGYGIASTGDAIEPLIPVHVDIKPGSDPNSVSCSNENGVIAVAVLTTEDFDATMADHTSVTFGGAGETHVDKRTGEPRRHEEDVDGDGDIDLVFHFRLGDTDLTCDSAEGTLTGETYAGLAIEGSDAIRMVDRGGGQP